MEKKKRSLLLVSKLDYLRTAVDFVRLNRQASNKAEAEGMDHTKWEGRGVPAMWPRI